MPKTSTCELSVEGMQCASCAVYVEKVLKEQQGVEQANAVLADKKVAITVDEGTDLAQIKKHVNKIMAKNGYKIVDNLQKTKRLARDYLLGALIALGIFGIFLYLQKSELGGTLLSGALTYPGIFLLGMFASISTCSAIVGGLSISVASKYSAANRTKGIVAFHVSRLIGYVLLGGLIGLLGRVVLITGISAAIIEIVLAVVLLGLGLDLVGFHIFSLAFPKQLGQKVLALGDEEGITPALFLGALTFFLPCAFTQSMQLYALRTGSFITGALVMGSFVLGTLPVLGVMSFTGARFTQDTKYGYINKAMGFLVLIFGCVNLLGGLAALGIIPHIL